MMKIKNCDRDAPLLPDCHQSAWQLAAIQLSGWTSLPVLATSILILQDNSFLGAALTLVVGNALLWFLRLGIISMSFKGRKSTLDIAHDYLGKWGHYTIAIVLLVTTLFWFVGQTTAGSNALTHLLTIQESREIDQSIQMSVFLGIVSTLFCMGGILLLRRMSVTVFPLLVVLFLLILYALPYRMPIEDHHPLSLSGLTLVLATNLGITVDLPTFFRHSQSWETSLKGLTITQLVSLALGLSSLCLGSVVDSEFFLNSEAILSGSGILRISLLLFLFLSVICTNVANVYSASVGWELVAPKALVGKKEYFILGLSLTTIFILISDLFSLDLSLNIADSSLVNLCLVLLIGGAIAKGQKNKPDAWQQNIYFIAWVLSTGINALQWLGKIPASPLLASLGAIGAVVIVGALVRRLGAVE
jgi:purine-cytosine permease-like protein